MQWQEHLNNSGVQNLNTPLYTQFLGGPKLKDGTGKERQPFSLGGMLHPRTLRVLAHHSREWSKAAGKVQRAVSFPVPLESVFTVRLPYLFEVLKFPEYQAHPYSNGSTKTHYKAKYKWFFHYELETIHQIRLIFFYMFNVAPSQKR